MSYKSITLYFKDGKSDKVYQAQIEKDRDGYAVNFQFGRRGGTLQTGSKTGAMPVSLNKAEEIYCKLISEKTTKGYTLGEDGTPYAGTVQAEQQFGQIPQLLNPIDEEDVKSYLENDDWLMQEKKDGVRQLVKRTDGTIQGGNRKGLCVFVSQPIANAIMSLHTKREPDFILDGEAMGDVYWPFDVTRYGGQSTLGMDADKRYNILQGLLDTFESPAIGRVPTAYTTTEKYALFEKIKAERGEGVVFKKLTSKYVAGKPASGGNQVKFKFKASATVLVYDDSNQGKRSVPIAVVDTIGRRPVGNVTIPSNYQIPSTGLFVEVEYLYAYPGGSLYQPVYKGPRADKDIADLYSTLKFKQGTGTEEDDA